MSIQTTIGYQQQEQTTGCAAVDLLIQPREFDLGGLTVRRVLPSRKRRMVGPWIFFDHMGPLTFPPGQGVDVQPHPHINLATVTYLFAGEILHRDSLGNTQAIRPGAINLMVAGRGIVHSERQPPALKAGNNSLHGLQLWLALPEAVEEIAAEFHHYGAEDIPATRVDGVPVRVLIGSAFGLTSPVKTFSETLYLEASLQAGERLDLAHTTEECAVYVLSGKARIDDCTVDAHTLAVLHTGHPTTLSALEASRIVMIGGAQLTPRHIWWNFVSSRRERIEQAKRDWHNGAFPKVPGDETEFIPLP